MNKLTAIAVLIFISTTFAQVNIEKYNNLNTSVKSIKRLLLIFRQKPEIQIFKNWELTQD